MKKTKRVLAFLLAVMMWLTALPVGILAGTESNALVIEADQVSGKAGDTVDMAIRITNNPGVVAFGIKVEYDKNVLTLKKMPEATNLLGGSTTYSEHVTDNPFVAVFENGEAESDVTAIGTLMVLSFEIKAGASAGVSAVKVSFTESGAPVNYDTATVAGETKNGSITVERGEIQTPCFVVSEAPAVVGQEVELTVSVENNPGIVAAELEIIYDADALELVKAEDQGLLAGGTFSENLSAKPYYLSWQQNETAAVNGTLATLTFLVKESGKHSVTLTVKSAQNTNLEPVDFEIVSGSITAQSMTFSVSEETGYPGETVELTLSVENNPGIVAAELELDFDRDVLELVGAADAGLLGGYTASQNYTDEPYYVSWMQNDPTAENGTLAILSFLVKEGCVSGKYPVELTVKSVQDTDLKPVACESINGTITVPAAVFSVSEATGYPGETVELTVDVKNNPGIISAELELDFDRDALELKTVKNGNLMSGETFSENLNAEPYYLSWLHNDPVLEDGTLAILTFQIKNGCNYDTYPVSLTVKSAQNTDMKSVGAEALAGAVTVVENEAIAPRFTLSEETGHVGGQVSVTLDISNNPGIVAAELELDYDRDVLELIKAESSGLMSGETFSESNAVKPYYMSWQQDNPTSENGTLVTLTFKVKDSCAVSNKSVVSVSVKSAVNTDLEDVIFKVTNGSVTVTEHDWQTVVYTWNADNTVCTAERTCSCGAKETESGTVTSETTDPTCTEKGKTVYTANFTKDGFVDQTLETVLDALGHDFHIIVNEDGESVRCCKRCGEIDPDYQGEKPETNMSVTFRLIGDFVHEDGVEDHEEYVTWIKTTTYTIHSGDTVYDVFAKALKEAGMKSKGASDGYVSAVQAPEVLGGYWLSELDNGPNSGWMYTVNGEHVSETLTEYVLENGDEILWHYIDDYSKEEKPNSKYYERWLEAEDISPETYVKRRLKDIVDIEGEGEVEPELKVSHIGENVKFIFTPEEGWMIEAVYVDGKAQGAIDSYTYKKLSLDSRIKVVFVKCGEALPVPNLWFLDVGEDDWFYDNVYFTVNNGLFNGVNELYFEPNTPMTRAMLVTVLYRMEGQPAVTGRSAFTDVQDGQWYTDAVVWATRKGVVNGYGDGRFGPNDPITREQMAAILFRYAGNKGYSVLARADLTAYTDHVNISGYAMDALSWANANGLIRGRTETTLVPDGQATRAEVAAILHRFLLNIVI